MRDKGGVGSRPNAGTGDLVTQYRQMRSKSYHDKIEISNTLPPTEHKGRY